MKFYSMLALLFAILACQQAPIESACGTLVFRSEVDAGVDGAIPCNASEGEVLWFGPPQVFHLQDSNTAVDAAGNPVILFQMVESEVEGFGDFTERLIGTRLAIEVDGRILSTPFVQSRLPGGGVISGGFEGFSEEEARELVAAIRGNGG